MAAKRTQFGTWQVRWRDASGRQRARSFKTRALAEKFERAALVDTERGLPTAPKATRHTVASWAEEWLAGAHNLREGGRDLYRRDLERHILPVLGDLPLARLAPADIDQFLAGRAAAGHAPSSLHRYWRTLRRMLNVAVERDVLPASPLRKVAAPRVPQSQMRFLTAERLEALALAAVMRGKDGEVTCDYRAMVLVAGWGGLRWSELAGLRPGNIEPGGVRVTAQLIDGRRWEEPKGNAQRFVSLPASVLELVRPMSDDLVFTSPAGRPLHHPNWRARVFAPAKRAAGVDEGFRPHDLRHTAVALAIAAGAHPKAIQARMGHSSIQVTLDRYGHLFPDIDTSLAAGLDGMRSDATPRPRAV